MTETMLPSPTFEPRSTLPPRGFVLPDWTELKLPPGCQYGRLSQNSQWLTYFCNPDQHKAYEGWLARISTGKIENPVFLNHVERIGFTPDNSGLIIKKEDNTWWLVRLPDLSEQHYSLDTFSVPDTLHLNGGLWSPDYSLVAITDVWQNIFVLSPSERTLRQVVKAPVQNGAQFSWSPNSQEIAYVEGFFMNGSETMLARVVNVRSEQSRTLVEDKIFMSGASWSPDGKWIAVRATDIGLSKTRLLLVNPQGDPILIFEYEWRGVEVQDGWQDLAWSPNGSKLALRGGDLQDRSGVLVIEIPSGKIVLQTTEHMRPVGWSTDSAWLLIQTYDLESKSDILRWIPIQ